MSSKIDNYIVHQEHDQVGIVPVRHWNKYQYEKELMPIRIALVEATDEYIQYLLDLYKNDIEGYKEELLNTLNEQCLYLT